MRQFPENYIYTACTGRCGQHSLGDFINRYALNTLVEVEPPQLLYPNNAPFGNYFSEIFNVNGFLPMKCWEEAKHSNGTETAIETV